MLKLIVLSVMVWHKATLTDSKHLELSILFDDVSGCQHFEIGIHEQRDSDFTAFLVDDVKDLLNDLGLNFLELGQQLWVLSEQQFCLIVKVVLFEFFVFLEELIVLWKFELSSQVHCNALEQIKRVLVKIVNHDSAMVIIGLIHALHLVLRAWIGQVLSCKLANVSPKVNERHINLFDVGNLFNI